MLLLIIAGLTSRVCSRAQEKHPQQNSSSTWPVHAQKRGLVSPGAGGKTCYVGDDGADEMRSQDLPPGLCTKYVLTADLLLPRTHTRQGKLQYEYVACVRSDYEYTSILYVGSRSQRAVKIRNVQVMALVFMSLPFWAFLRCNGTALQGLGTKYQLVHASLPNRLGQGRASARKKTRARDPEFCLLARSVTALLLKTKFKKTCRMMMACTPWSCSQNQGPVPRMIDPEARAPG